MKTLFKSLFAVCITAMLCCVICCTASAESINSFSTTHTDTNSNNIQFGADITYNVPDPAKNEVIATITKCYKDEPVDIPETVSYFDIETGDSTDYKIISLVMEQGAADDLNTTLTVFEGLRDISGNLFDFRPTKDRNLIDSDNLENSYAIYNGILKVPDTQKMLNNIPAFISDNYENGAYYAGKCLVRVDTDYEGNFSVKDGTVCILASAFEGCKKLGAVTLPETIEFIGARAFANSSVTSVNIPSGLTDHDNKIASMAFYCCDKLTTVKCH